VEEGKERKGRGPGCPDCSFEDTRQIICRREKKGGGREAESGEREEPGNAEKEAT